MVCKERTLVLIKPDGVKRCLVGRIISRFEDSGMKIIGMKLTHVPEDLAASHYTQDIADRRGEHVRNALLHFIRSGPVVAICVKGINAIENIRKLVGSTEPKSALPGTIRGDFTHVSFQQADHDKKAVANVIHASADAADAEREVALWFNEDELQDYETVHEVLTF